MTLPWTLASRYMGGRRLRTLLTTLAVVFGVLLVFGGNTVLPAISQAFRVNLMGAAGQVDLTITARTGGAFPSENVARVQAVEGVLAVSGSLDRTVNLPADFLDHDPALPDAITAISLVGIDPGQAQSLHAYPIVAGRFLRADDGDAALLSRSLADALALELSGVLILPTTQGQSELTIVGILPARALPGNEQVLVSLAEAQRLLDQPGQINLLELNYDTLDAERRAEIQQRVESTLGQGFRLGGLTAGDELLANLQTGQAIFSVLGALGLFMGGFIIFNTFRTIITERKRDLAMLRALGATRRMVTGLVLTESLIQGAVGTALGLGLGYVFGAGILSAMRGIFEQYVHVRVGAPVISPALLAVSIGVGVGLTLVAGLLPAWRAGRVPPLEALRPSVAEVLTARAQGVSFFAGTAMIMVALAGLLTHNVGMLALGGVLFLLGLVLVGPVLVRPIAVGFGRLFSRLNRQDGIAHLAEGNLTRQPSRAAVTASATMIGLAVIVMAAALINGVSGGFLDALRRSLGSDYLFIPPAIGVWGSNVGASPKLAEELRALPSVGAVSTLRAAPSRTGSNAFTVLGIDPAEYPVVSGLVFQEGDPNSAYRALGEGRNLIANGVLATVAGWHIGEEVRIFTPDGEATYRVSAIAIDYLNAKIATAYISQATMLTDFHVTEDVLLQANLKPGADRAQAAAEVKALAAHYPQFRLIAGREYYEENKRLFDAAFFGMYVVLAFLAIPSLVAMLNTLAIGVIERTREIGLVRAEGATRRQVRRMVVIEALILAALGTSFGLLSGLYLGRLAVDGLAAAGYPVRASFPLAGIVLTIAIGLLFGVLAALIPSRQAAKMDIVAALRFE